MTYTKDNIEFAQHPSVRTFLDLTGQRFTYLVVLGLATRRPRTFWWCECDCGQIRKVTSLHLRQNHTRSCGCFNIQSIAARSRSHGETVNGIASPEYRSFTHARDRCQNINDRAFPNYGGRGIEFRFESFEEFLAEIGRRPTVKHSVERKNNDGHYEKGNVRWATKSEQARNKRNTVHLTIDGQSKPLAEWAETMNVSANTIHNRRFRGSCDRCAVSGERCTHPSP